VKNTDWYKQELYKQGLKLPTFQTIRRAIRTAKTLAPPATNLELAALTTGVTPVGVGVVSPAPVVASAVAVAVAVARAETSMALRVLRSSGVV
jgi:hypothetical protein